MPRNCQGYTLTELIVVLALLGLLTALAVPALSHLAAPQNLDLAARELAVNMRLARQKAITSGATQIIEFHLHSDTYRVKDTGTNEAFKVKLPEGVSYGFINFPKTGGFPCLSFLKSGAPSRGGTVSFAGPGGLNKHVIITPATGRVRISDQAFEDE